MTRPARKNDTVGSGSDSQKAPRYEVPAATWSWMQDGQPVFVRIGAHCVDPAWPWWQPWTPDGPSDRPTFAELAAACTLRGQVRPE